MALKAGWLLRAAAVGFVAVAASGCAGIGAGEAAKGDPAKGDPAKGEAVAAQWCSQCHTIRGVQSDPKRPPTFEQVAAREGRDRAWLRRFLNEDHFPMTTYRLLDDEKDDVVAMIVSLKP